MAHIQLLKVCQVLYTSERADNVMRGIDELKEVALRKRLQRFDAIVGQVQYSELSELCYCRWQCWKKVQGKTQYFSAYVQRCHRLIGLS
jgi:hypothetical protein